MTSLRCSDILVMVSGQVRGSGLWSKVMMKAEHNLTVSEPGVLLTEREMFHGKPLRLKVRKQRRREVICPASPNCWVAES